MRRVITLFLLTTLLLGVAMQFNYLIDEGAIEVNEKAGTFSIYPTKIRARWPN